jgi:adenylate cyclase
MTCSGCGAKLDPGFSFCPHCGCRQTACAQCGTACKDDFAFCPNCGAPRKPAPVAATQPQRETPAPTTSPQHADRRNVTVLFADVAGFTTLAERLDPEDVRAFQNDLFQALAKSIERFDGFIEKFVGDAVLAIFGAPVAHEDDPERALGAALDMVSACETLSERWAGHIGRPVRLHIGIHTGPVVAGSFDATAGAAYAVTGDTVNTAARLLGAAGDAILVSETTCGLTLHRFAFEPHPDLALRGKSESIRARRLVGRLAQPGSSRGLAGYGLAGPMVGRSDELDQLIAALHRMKQGRTQVVSVVGEAGLGKSRLIAEFLARIDVNGAAPRLAIRQAACSSLGEPTYGVFGALFREAYRVEKADPLIVAREKLENGLRELGTKEEVIAEVAPMLGYLLGVDSFCIGDLEPEQLNRQITLAACTLLEQRLQQQPLLIVVEDVHWSDAASIDLLCAVADRLPDRPLMVLLSHRPETPPPRLARVAQTVVRVARLSDRETQALVSGLFGEIDTECAQQLVGFVTGRATGNPYFIEEIVRGLIDEGALVRQDGHWICARDRGADHVPATLAGLLLSRIDKLSPDARRVLEEAAVVGLEFDEADILAICANPAGVASALQTLADADLIEREDYSRAPRHYRFKHALGRDTVYQNILVTRRSLLHARIGEALDRAVAGRPARLDELVSLGHHWSLSPDKAKGARYLAAAGDWARSVYANEDSIRHYQRALLALAEAEGCDELELTVRENLADLQVLTGRRTEARANYDILLGKFEAAQAHKGAARMNRKAGCMSWDAGDRDEARALFAAGLARLEEQDRTERAQLFQELGLLAFRTGDNESAIEWAQNALKEAAAGEQRPEAERNARETAEIRAHAHNTLGIALARQGRLDDAIEQLRRSIDLADEFDLPKAICRGCANLGVLYGSSDPKLGIATCMRGLDAAKKSGDLGFQSRLYANLAVAYCAASDQCDADGVAAARRAVELDRRLGYIDHLAAPLIVLGQIHQCHGERELAFASYEEALEVAERVGEPQLLFPCYDGLATLYLDMGERERAELYLSKAQKVCEQAGIEPDALMILPFLT